MSEPLLGAAAQEIEDFAGLSGLGFRLVLGFQQFRACRDLRCPSKSSLSVWSFRFRI